MSLPAQLRLGAVALTVTDLDRSVGFYQEALGFQVHKRENGTAALGAGGEDLLVLHERPDARPAGRHAGLFHVAYLFSSRAELGRALARLGATRTQLTGASDHGVSDALYLRDPDGNGIELYRDLPREEWPPPERPGERVGMFTRPLDLQALLDDAAPGDGMDGGLRVGHVHLHVGDVARAESYYADTLGFDVMTHYPGAVFLSAGGYHHHLAANTWQGEGIGPAPEDAVGLRHWTIVLPDPGSVAAVRDRVDGAEEADGGVIVRDPWSTAALVTAA